jgi:hypothetical protein
VLGPPKACNDGQFGAILNLLALAWEPLCPPQTGRDLYRTALTESDPGKLNGRIEAASSSIRERLEQTEDTRERQLLNNALYALETLLAKKRCA